MKFELSRLGEYDNESLLEEIRRVAELFPADQPLTVAGFQQHAKVDPSTIRRRFGGWANALAAAGLAGRYGGRTVSDKMKAQEARAMTDEDLVRELCRVADFLETEVLTQPQFNSASRVSAAAVRRRFGSWTKALDAAGLRPVSHGRRYTEDDYFENLLAVWTRLARQPHYGEMALPPSTITPGAYEHRWGSWRRALSAFVDRVNADEERASVRPVVKKPVSQAPILPITSRRRPPHLVGPIGAVSVSGRDRQARAGV